MPAAARFGRAHLAHWAPLGGPTVTLISDLPHSRRVAYVGLDNRAAGRTTAYLIARFMGPLAHSPHPRAQHGDLAGIYNIGGGAEGIGRALKEAGSDRKIVFIGHGLTPDTRALLIDGTMDAVITQNP